MIEIRFKRLPHGAGLPAPAYATAGAAGMDVVAAEDLVLAPGARHAVATGFALANMAIYFLMALTLIWRPFGIFGKPR